MKKILLLFLVFIGILSSCTPTPTPTAPPKDPLQNVIDEIASLGTSATLDRVASVENLYNNLSDEQKKSVTNYNDLLYYKECADFRYRLSSAGESGEKILASKLKNPQSLQVHSWVYWSYTDDPNAGTDRRLDYIKIRFDYSAQNGFGGYNRDYIYIYMYWSVYTNEWKSEFVDDRIGPPDYYSSSHYYECPY